MNAPNQWYQDEEVKNDFDYQANFRRGDSATEMKANRRDDHRTKNRPASANGIHRRRNKRWSW
jgi:hypothetical protein